MDLQERLREYVELEERRRELEEELELVRSRMEALSQALVDQFIDAGIAHIRVGPWVVYLAQEIWARPNGDHEALAEALKAANLGDLVDYRVNRVRLSAWVRELIRSGEELPPELADLIKVSEVSRIRIRKA